MARVMIIGGSGFVGRNLSRCFSLRHDVLVTRHTGRPPDSACLSVELNLLDPESIRSAVRAQTPDFVINAAGNKNVRFCEDNPAAAMAINAEATERIAAACAEQNVPLAHISTDLVFDGDRGDYLEDEIPEPSTVYGRSKLEGERSALRVNPDCLIVRTGGVYGLDSPLLDWLRGELNAGKSVECFEDVRNTPTFADNLAEIIAAASERRLTGAIQAVGRRSYSRHQLFVAFAREFALNEALLVPVDAGIRRKEMLLAADSSLSSAVSQKRLPGVVFNTAREGFRRLTGG